MSTQAFLYDPLLEPDSFRILHLQPSPDRTAQIHCTLEHTRLSAYDYDIIVQYTALSYVWGDASDQRIVHVNGQPVSITRNLYDALECLRDEKRVSYIWADAICINQLDLLERNSQVRQMGRIFSTATHTVIFLGQSSRNLDVIILQFSSIVEPQRVFSPTQFEHVRRPFGFVMAQPWWGRVWTLQELVLSKDPFIQCGLTRMRWDNFLKFVSLFARSAPPLLDIKGSGAGFMNHVMEIRNSYMLNALGVPGSEVAKLTNLVKSRRGFGASDPRDIVFAQLGLTSSEGTQNNLKVDYRNTTASVYAEMTYQMLAEKRDTFSELERRNATSHPLNLPSWVPDWSTSWQRPPRQSVVREAFGRESRGVYGTWKRVNVKRNKYALSMNMILAGEIVQMGRAIGLNFHEEVPLSGYFDPGINPNIDSGALQDILKVWTESGGYRSYPPLVYSGVGKMLHAWATTIGLPKENMLPTDDIDPISLTYHRILSRELEQVKTVIENPLLLLSINQGFTASPDASLLAGKTRGRLIATDLFCTIKCKYPQDQQKEIYQIIPVPEMSQVGDIIANIDLCDLTDLLVIRPIDLTGPESDRLPLTYKVIGTCHMNGGIKGSYDISTLCDTVTLV
ncbi:hypothetical protein VTL71DRAFT_8981 [Oculimacula yallundae]|uniref:Heterokaryon incompatibility domain-containing protein n=1 Tax=Oculimacula yallundae TaxID=86028 RepID=A0ABR4BTE7_9HELO